MDIFATLYTNAHVCMTGARGDADLLYPNLSVTINSTQTERQMMHHTEGYLIFDYWRSPQPGEKKG